LDFPCQVHLLYTLATSNIYFGFPSPDLVTAEVALTAEESL
jgi:hypothetical protein